MAQFSGRVWWPRKHQFHVSSRKRTLTQNHSGPGMPQFHQVLRQFERHLLDIQGVTLLAVTTVPHEEQGNASLVPPITSVLRFFLLEAGRLPVYVSPDVLVAPGRRC